MNFENIALVLFGVAFYYAILWSSAKNKKSKAKKARLALCDQSSAGKAERGQIHADDQYVFHFKEWAKDNSDEMVISIFSSVALILFDTVAADLVNRKFFPDDPIELGKAIYLFGGVGGDMLYRLVDKMRNG